MPAQAMDTGITNNKHCAARANNFAKTLPRCRPSDLSDDQSAMQQSANLSMRQCTHAPTRMP